MGESVAAIISLLAALHLWCDELQAGAWGWKELGLVGLAAAVLAACIMQHPELRGALRL